MSRKLEKLRKELEALKQQQQEKSQQVRQETNRVTHRRQLVLGRYVERRMERDKPFKENVLRALNRDLTRAADRALFDLPGNEHEEAQDEAEETSGTG